MCIITDSALVEKIKFISQDEVCNWSLSIGIPRKYCPGGCKNSRLNLVIMRSAVLLSAGLNLLPDWPLVRLLRTYW